jgi:hypothetical protein
MIRSMIQAVLCFLLCSQLVAQQVMVPASASHAPQPSAPAPAATAPHALSEFVTIPKSTDISLVTLESVSSATATKGQLVRLRVEHSVMADGLVVIPKGTLATGEVTDLRSVAAGKQSGFIRIRPVSLTLGNGMQAKLREFPPDDAQCGDLDLGSCWVGYTLLVPISLVFLIQIAIDNHHEKRQIHKGEDRTRDACSRVEGFTTKRIILRRTDLQAANSPGANAAADAPCRLLN